MFTGIITNIGTIEHIRKEGDWRFTIACEFPADSITLGDSIACSGVCLTVTSIEPRAGGSIFTVDVSQETLSCTTLSTWEKDTRINLEQALRAGDRLGGHIVSGHVDGLATLTAVDKVDDSHRLTLALPHDLAYLVAAKGSITLDGISLTVNAVLGNTFTVNIIPHTWQHTTLCKRKVGDKINLEVDMLARYVARLMEQQQDTM